MSFAACVFVSLSVLCSAQTERAPKEPAPTVVYPKKTIIDFSGVRLTGEVQTPNSSYLLVKERLKFKSLVRVRTDFRPELVRSLEDVE